MQFKRTAKAPSLKFKQGANNIEVIDEDRMATIIEGNSRFFYHNPGTPGTEAANAASTQWRQT